MGNSDSKLNFRKAIVQLTAKNQVIDAKDESFWNQFWSEHGTNPQDVFALIPANEIRMLRDENPGNLATLCYKATERLAHAVDNSCRTQAEQQAVLNCVRLLSRILPYIFEEAEWRNFFWSSLPSGNENDDSTTPLAQSLLNAICDLLFCPDFTVVATKRSGPDKPEELANIDSCEYIWEAGVGFAHSPPKNATMELRRTELLKLLLTCFSETMYRTPNMSEEPNKWIAKEQASPLHAAVCKADCGLTPLNLKDRSFNPLSGVKSDQEWIDEWKSKAMHDGCVLGSSLLRRRGSCVPFRTAWSPSELIKSSMKERVENDQCRMCGSALETLDHLTSRCTVMAPVQYIHQNLAYKHGLITGTCRVYRYEPQAVLDSSAYSMYWDRQVLTDRHTPHNKPDVLHFTSADNRHALPLFTSLLNTVSAYDPVGLGVPYNHLLFSDTTEPLVEACLQILIVTLDHDMTLHSSSSAYGDEGFGDNLFINYLSRVHRDEDFQFILKGITRLLNNPLMQSYLPNSTKRLHCHQELLVFFWKICDYNKKFLYFVLKSSDVLDVLVPILYHLNDSRADQSRVGLMHIGVFILLLLSGERNFGVRLNKPYTATVPMDIPVFTGTHADLLITVFHKIIATGHQRLQPLFDCLLTILVNVSPYLKTLSMVASIKLLHLLEAFSTPWFLFSAPSNHHLVFFLLEIFNNIIQYQFDGNSNLVYTIIRKRHVFHALANLPSDMAGIAKCLSARKGGRFKSVATTVKPEDKSNSEEVDYSDGENKIEIVEESMEGSTPAMPAEPGTLKASLLDTPGIGQMTEKESAHLSALPEYQTDREDCVSNDLAKVSPSKSSPSFKRAVNQRGSIRIAPESNSLPTVWTPTAEWVSSWRAKLPLQTIMRLLQVLVPQVEKICIDKGLTDESEILKFLQHGTLVGLLPVPHPILIRKYQANSGTTAWFRTYMWGVIYLRNVDPAIWYDTEVKLFEIQRV